MSSVASLARHYLALGLRPGASRGEVELAFRAAALRTHPDRGGCASAFAEVRAARNALCAALDGNSGAPWALGNLGSVRAAHSGHGDRDTRESWHMMGAIVLPAAVGMALAFRLLYLDAGNRTRRPGVRAGGNSRVYKTDLANEPGMRLVPTSPGATDSLRAEDRGADKTSGGAAAAVAAASGHGASNNFVSEIRRNGY